MTTCLFKRKAFIPLTYKGANDVLNYVKKMGGKFYLSPYIKSLHKFIGFNCFIEDGMRYIKLTCKYKGKIATYVFDKISGTREEASVICSIGMKAYSCLQRFTKGKEIKKIVKDSDFNNLGKNPYPFATSPFMYFNEKYNETEQEAYGYDMNSAYSYAMLGNIPDTSELTSVKIRCYNEGIVKKGEIGFNYLGDLVEEGCFALYRFKAIKSPFKDFVEYYFTLKHNAKTKKERKRAKDILNMSVGYLQRINPFIRATIVSRANNLIKSLIDENTLYCNTDSIVSLKPREDLKIGSNIGEWKLEHKGKFRYRDYNYQWNNELPAYRGIPKAWFKEGYNLLEDDIPVCGNNYELDYIKFIIKKVEL